MKGTWHIGRHFGGPGDIEFACPCPKAECGLVSTDNFHPDCPQHPHERAKTLRSGHKAEVCEGPDMWGPWGPYMVGV